MSPAPSSTTRSRLIRWTAVAVTLLTLTLAYRRIDLAAVADGVLHARWRWFLAAELALGLGLAAAAGRWHILLRLANSAVHAGVTWRMTRIGHFFNTVLFGPAGGDFAKSLHYREWYRHPASSILATCTLDRAVGGAGFLVFSALTAAAAFAGGDPLRPFQWHLPRLPGPAILGAGALALALVLLILYRIGAPQPILLFAGALRTRMRELVNRPSAGLRATALAIVAHAFMNSILLFCLQAVSRHPVPWFDLLWLLPVMSVATSTTLSVAGAGMRESSALILFGWYGIPAADAVAAALLALAVHITWTTIGAVTWWRTSRFHSRLPATTEEPTLSVVIPTLNEGENLPETVRHLRAIPEIIEIIVADGGSSDDTVAVARNLECEVVRSSKGRGTQLRAGAAAARGDVLLLVHADTWLPPEAGRAVRSCLRDATVVGGGFWKRFRNGTWLMAGSRPRCALRLWLFGRVAGDQVLFARADALEQVGGVPDLPLMEEFELCRRLRTKGRLALAGVTITTSARRFRQHGVLRTYARMWRVTLQYYLGTSTGALARIYDRDPSASGEPRSAARPPVRIDANAPPTGRAPDE